MVLGIKMKHYRRWGIAWVSLACALALHVIDEAMTGFLPLYNSLVRSRPESWSWVPLPTFSFGEWIAGLAVGISAIFVLSPQVFAGKQFMRPVSYFLGILMSANGLGHISASLYLGRLAPGALSSPLLLVASAFLLFAAHRSTFKVS